MLLPIITDADEVGILPQVGTVDELAASPASCFCELLPHRDEPADLLFPLASSRHGGEVAAPAWWSAGDAHIRALHLFKVRDAFLFPGWGVVVARDGRAMRLTTEEARYSSPDLAALPHMVPHGGGVALDVPDGVERLSAAAAIMPAGATANYGHFVLDALPSLAILDEVGALARFPAVVPGLRPWQARHFALMGLEPRETARPILRVDELIYTSGMHHFLHNPNMNLRAVPRRQVPRVAPAGAGAARRLYLSRGAGNSRRMSFEGRLLRALQREGFEAIDTGRMSVDDQIARFAAAEVVLGATGAAFSNVLYCRPGTRVVEIQPAGMENHWVQGLCFFGGLHHAAYFCGGRPTDPRHPERGLRYGLDVDRFLAFALHPRGTPPPGAAPRARSLLSRLLGPAR